MKNKKKIAKIWRRFRARFDLARLKKIKKIKWSKLSLKQRIQLVAGVVLLLILLAAIGLYFYGPLGKITYPIFKRLPYPVAIVGEKNKVITSRDLIFNTEAVKQFYSSQDYSELGLRVDFSTEEGQKRFEIKEKDVLNKMIENKLLVQLAAERGIKISQKEVQAEIDQQIKKHSSEEQLKSSLKKLYGWTIADFRDEVVIYQMVLKKLFNWYSQNLTQTKSYQKIEEAKGKLKKDGSNFGQLAKEYSDGESANNEGRVGWFNREQLVEEVAEVAFKMKTGEISEIIISPLGFHIIKVEETRKVSPEGDVISDQLIPEVKLSQVYVKGENFIDWLAKKKQQAEVNILMRKYRWDEQKGQVIFRDQVMQNMEKRIRLKSEGDPSL